MAATGSTSRYGTLGNLDRVFLAHGRTLAGVEVGGQGFKWTAGSGASVRFTGGDNDTKYHISLNFAALTDKIGRAVPTNDCRKIYMVFAPRFEATEAELQDGCFLTAGVDAVAAAWSVDDVSQLTGGRYFIGDPANEERVLLLATDTGQVTVQRGYEGTTPRAWSAGARMKKLSPKSGFASDVEWSAVISNIAVTGDSSLKVGGAARADRGVGRAVQVHRLLGELRLRRRPSRRSGGAVATRSAPRPPTAATSARSSSPIRRRRSTISTSARSSTRTAAR